jgi:preprotein translocase subunit SecY
MFLEGTQRSISEFIDFPFLFVESFDKMVKRYAFMKATKVKGIILLVIAAVFLFVMVYSLVYSAGDLKVFFSVVIVLVCGGLGIMYLKDDENNEKKRHQKKGVKK